MPRRTGGCDVAGSPGASRHLRADGDERRAQLDETWDADCAGNTAAPGCTRGNPRSGRRSARPPVLQERFEFDTVRRPLPAAVNGATVCPLLSRSETGRKSPDERAPLVDIDLQRPGIHRLDAVGMQVTEDLVQGFLVGSGSSVFLTVRWTCWLPGRRAKPRRRKRERTTPAPTLPPASGALRGRPRDRGRGAGAPDRR